MDQKREALTRLAIELQWSQSDFDRALDAVSLKPDRLTETAVIRRLAIVNAFAFMLAGTALFFAYNWHEMPRFTKFALLQAAVAVPIIAVIIFGRKSLFSKAMLFTGAFMTGILLAIIGQTYQSGADPYELFLAWAVLITPWVLIGRQAALWLLWMLLCNVTLCMYWSQIVSPQDDAMGLLGPIFDLWFKTNDTSLALTLTLLNGAFLLLWERSNSTQSSWMDVRWLPRSISSIMLFSVTFPATLIALDIQYRSIADSNLPLLLTYLICLPTMLWYYQKKQRDVVILAQVALSAMLVVNASIMPFLGQNSGSLLLMALLLIAQSTALAYWLKNMSNLASARKRH